jgi:hypothetical protein
MTPIYRWSSLLGARQLRMARRLPPASASSSSSPIASWFIKTAGSLITTSSGSSAAGSVPKRDFLEARQVPQSASQLQPLVAAGWPPAAACRRTTTTAATTTTTAAAAAQLSQPAKCPQVALFTLFDGTSYAFDIPPYQRSYSWRSKQVYELLRGRSTRTMAIGRAAAPAPQRCRAASCPHEQLQLALACSASPAQQVPARLPLPPGLRRPSQQLHQQAGVLPGRGRHHPPDRRLAYAVPDHRRPAAPHHAGGAPPLALALPACAWCALRLAASASAAAAACAERPRAPPRR